MLSGAGFFAVGGAEANVFARAIRVHPPRAFVGRSLFNGHSELLAELFGIWLIFVYNKHVLLMHELFIDVFNAAVYGDDVV